MKIIYITMVLTITLSFALKAQSDSTKLYVSIAKLDTVLHNFPVAFFGIKNKGELSKSYSEITESLKKIKKKSSDINKYKENISKIDTLISNYYFLRIKIANSIGYKIRAKENNITTIDSIKINIPTYDLLSINTVKTYWDIISVGFLIATLSFGLLGLTITFMNKKHNLFISKQQMKYSFSVLQKHKVEFKGVVEFFNKIADILDSKEAPQRGVLLAKLLNNESIENFIQANNQIESNAVDSVIIPLSPSDDSNAPPVVSNVLPKLLPTPIETIFLSNPDITGFFNESTVQDRLNSSYAFYKIELTNEFDNIAKIHFVASDNEKSYKNIIFYPDYINPVCISTDAYDKTKIIREKANGHGTVTKENNGWRIKDKIKIEYV